MDSRRPTDCRWTSWSTTPAYIIEFVTSALAVHMTRLSAIGDRAFPVAEARTWNSLPSEVTSSSVSDHLRLNLRLICFPHLSHSWQQKFIYACKVRGIQHCVLPLEKWGSTCPLVPVVPRSMNKGGIEHSVTLIIKSTFCTVAKFVPELCISVNLAWAMSSKYSTKHVIIYKC